MRRLLPLALLVLLALVGCFEEPVEESVHLDLGEGGAVEITARTRIPAIHLDSPSPRLDRRLRQRQKAMAEGWDGWPARFAAAAPAAEEITFRRDQGRLVEAVRQGSFTAPDAVERFFADRVTARYLWDEEVGRGELAFYPTVGGPATGGERQYVERALRDWSVSAADYLAAVAALYRHLEEFPGKSRPAFQVLFADLLSDADTEAARLLLNDQERRLVAEVSDAMDGLLAILLVGDDAAFTLNELSRRVYDPFPGEVTVSAAGAVTEVEGFVERGDGRWAVPKRDLWTAFTALEGRWVAPDPARAYVAASLAADLDLDTLLAADLTAAPAPTPTELREALEAGLVPEPEYRLGWRTGN